MTVSLDYCQTLIIKPGSGDWNGNFEDTLHAVKAKRTHPDIHAIKISLTR